jgi:hypothetical protein
MGMVVIAIDPWTPRFIDLSTDNAHVQYVGNKNGGATARLISEQGLLLTCQDNYKPTGACPAKVLQEAMKSNVLVKVWHDKKFIYQAEVSGKLVINYSRVYTGRRFLAAFFGILSSIPLFVVLGRKFGLLNKPAHV